MLTDRDRKIADHYGHKSFNFSFEGVFRESGMSRKVDFKVRINKKLTRYPVSIDKLPHIYSFTRYKRTPSIVVKSSYPPETTKY